MRMNKIKCRKHAERANYTQKAVAKLQNHVNKSNLIQFSETEVLLSQIAWEITFGMKCTVLQFVKFV